VLAFVTLGVGNLWNAALDASERRIALARQEEREKLDDQRWGLLLGIKPPVTIKTKGDLEVRMLTQIEQRKLTVLLRAMSPYNVEVYHAPNPVSAGVAKQFEEVFRDAGWKVTAAGVVDTSVGYTVISRPYVENLPPGVHIVNADRISDAKGNALVGLLWEFDLPASGGSMSEVPADTVVVEIGAHPYDQHITHWHYPPDQPAAKGDASKH
jgi:hypothetical protein